MEMSEELKKELMEFQQLQQQLQLASMQKQQLMLQSAELDKAIEEVKKSEGSFYRFTGSVIVPKKKDALEKELAEEKESLEMRKNIFQKQEDKIRQRLVELQKKLQSMASAEKKGYTGEGATAK
jgi:prefoldin beta subunit